MLLALVLAAVVQTPTPATSFRATVVLRDGTRYAVVAPYNPHDRIVTLRLAGGKTVSVTPGDIDAVATKSANAPPSVTPTPSGFAGRPIGDRTPRAGSGTISITGSSSSGGSYGSPPSDSGAQSSGPKEVQVKGYTRSDGTYVAPHTRSAPKKN